MNRDLLPVLGDLVYRHAGLKLDHIRQDDILSTVDLMMATLGTHDAGVLFHKLEVMSTHHPIWQMLLRRVTVGETYFFRHMSQYDTLRDRILPQIIEERRKSGLKHLNLWSAGCATGEEPYSIAILLREMLPDIADWSISLLATDINATALDAARTGIYRDHSFRLETRPDIRERYFENIGGMWELNTAIRRMVNFAPLNLISDHYPSFVTRTSHLDLIICRNVTIYFDEETTRGVVSRFCECLLEHGWLIVGHAEPLATVYQGFAARNFEATVVYQKSSQPQPQFPYQELKPDPVVKAPAALRPAKRKTSSPASTPPMGQRTQPAQIEYTLQQVKEAADREDWEAAMGMFKQMERSYTLNPAFHYWRGLVLIHTDNHAEAKQALRRALYCDSQFSLAHYLLGEIAFQEGNMKEALRCWQQSLQAVAHRPAEKQIIEQDALTVDELRVLIHSRLDTAKLK